MGASSLPYIMPGGFLKMPIYFVRHGSALPEHVDPNRSLSAEGRREIERVAAHLKKAGVAVKTIYHSGKTRARETARILAKHIGAAETLEVSGMNPNDNVMEFAAGLKDDSTMYVGHLPHLGKLVSYLVAGDENAGLVKFETGGIVCIEKDGTDYHIEWDLQPSLCQS
jgi:phosphohistidine phosphatase